MLTWRDAEQTTHRRGHVALMGKAGSDRHIARRHRSRGKQRTGAFDATADDVLMSGDAGAVAKQALQSG